MRWAYNFISSIPAQTHVQKVDLLWYDYDDYDDDDDDDYY